MLYVLLFISLCALIYCTVASVMQVPSFKSAKVVTASTVKPVRKGVIGNAYDYLSQAVQKVVIISEAKEDKIRKLLYAAGIAKTPREYMAGNYIKIGGAGVVAGSLALQGSSGMLIGILIVAAVVVLVRANLRFMTKTSQKNKIQIEKDLPRFVSYLSSSFQANRNIPAIFARYIANFDSALTEELKIALADMSTGNIETALSRLAQRIDSTLMTEVVSALISASRGNEMTQTFNQISNKAAISWTEALEAEAQKKKKKITQKAVLLCIMTIVMIFTVLLSSIGDVITMVNI